MRRHELSNEQWEKIKDLLPPERKPQGGRPAKNSRIMMNGIIYWLNTGVAWRDLPERFGSWQSDIVDYENIMIDSTIIKVHQHANGLKKGHQKQKDVQEAD